MWGIFINWIVRPIVSVLIGQFALYLCRMFDFYPERAAAFWVAELISQPQSDIAQLVQWGLAAFIGVALLVLDELRRRRAKVSKGPDSSADKLLAEAETRKQLRLTRKQEIGRWVQTAAISDERPNGIYEWMGPPPPRDVWAFTAICRMFSGRWEDIVFDLASPGIGQENSDRLYRIAVSEFRQLAHDGKIPVWGKRSSQDIWHLVPPSHWRNHEIDWMRFLSALEGHPEVLKSSPVGNGSHVDVWLELMTSKADVDDSCSTDS